MSILILYVDKSSECVSDEGKLGINYEEILHRISRSLNSEFLQPPLTELFNVI
jgi:hypothetical protein